MLATPNKKPRNAPLLLAIVRGIMYAKMKSSRETERNWYAKQYGK